MDALFIIKPDRINDPMYLSVVLKWKWDFDDSDGAFVHFITE